MFGIERLKLCFLNKRYYKNSKGFTLAEVLIALAIIGVVAAMVIPAILQNSKNNELVVRVKKYDGLLKEAIKRYSLDNGCLGDLSQCNAFNNGDTMENTDHANIWNAIKPYLNLTRDCGTNSGQGCFPPGVSYKYINNSDTGLIYDEQNYAKGSLTDGSSIALFDYAGNCNLDRSYYDTGPLFSVCAWVLLDVNGYKGPNQYGRDSFHWYITKSGVYPFGALDDLYADNSGNPGCNPTSSDITNFPKPGGGWGCTAKILREGAMNY